MYTAKVTDAKKEFSLADNKSYLDVSFDVLSNDVVVSSLRQSFPLGTDVEEIKATLKKHCQTLEDDIVRADACAEIAVAEAAAEETLSQIKGLSIE